MLNWFVLSSRYGEWPHQSVKSTNVVKLPNPHNCIYNALRFESQTPERKKVASGTKAYRMGRITGELH